MSKIPVLDDEAHCVTNRDLCQMLGVSLSTVASWKAQGRLPKPLAGLGRSVRYLLSEIKGWMAAGCPDQAAWEKLKAAQAKASKK